MIEIYKDIIGYEGIYQVSNLGNVKSYKNNKERQLKLSKNSDGYSVVGLRTDNVAKTKKVHQLVAEMFLNHKVCRLELVINHIDFNKTNNNVNNLEIVTVRQNTNRKHIKSSSIHTGVSWDKSRNKWVSHIYLNGKLKHIGRFENELDASKAYQLELSKI
jgi:hypothetical protein